MNNYFLSTYYMPGTGPSILKSLSHLILATTLKVNAYFQFASENSKAQKGKYSFKSFRESMLVPGFQYSV